MDKLADLKNLDDDRALVKAACFYVGWMLLSSTSWQYKAIFTQECGEVTLNALIAAVTAKNKTLTVSSKEVTIKKL